MASAALTFVYNEAINLPIWIKHYGHAFGPENLYVIDQSSDDGSTANLGPVNVVKVPRHSFDEVAKTNIMSSFHTGLTSLYDAVIVTDCDEMVVADPARYRDLPDYIARMESPYVNGIGIDVIHLISDELPLDLTRPILSQRRLGRFHAPECKQLLSRVPVRWLPGLHSSDKPPRFDPDLFVIHLKLMDYGMAVLRHRSNMQTVWSEDSLKFNYGAHHRWPMGDFVRQAFLIPLDIVHRNEVKPFEFAEEIDRLVTGTVLDASGFYRVPMNLAKYVAFPERFATLI